MSHSKGTKLFLSGVCVCMWIFTFRSRFFFYNSGGVLWFHVGCHRVHPSVCHLSAHLSGVCLSIFSFVDDESIDFHQTWYAHCEDLGPVVQSIVSLTSSLRVISLTVLAVPIYNILKCFAGKMCVAFALQKLLTFFQQKISAYLLITRCKF